MTTFAHEQSMTFNVAPMNQDAINLFFGEPLTDPDLPTHSLVLDQKVTLSGEPARPAKAKGLRAWLYGNRRALRAFYDRHEKWVKDGCPTSEGTQRYYFPRVTIQAVT